MLCDHGSQAHGPPDGLGGGGEGAEGGGGGFTTSCTSAGWSCSASVGERQLAKGKFRGGWESPGTITVDNVNVF